MRRLEIGPGPERLEGFETLSVLKGPQVDHVGDARRPPLPDMAFDMVYSAHCIEHVHWYEVEDTIKAWARLLKPGGELEVHTVDGLKLMKALVELEETGVWTGPGSYLSWRQDLVQADPYKWAVGRMLSYPKRGSGDVNLHRAIITPAYLARCFALAGIVDLDPLGPDDLKGHKHGWISFGLKGRRC